MKGFWNDWTGACHKVEIKTETIDGRYVIYWQPIGLLIVPKSEILLAKEGKNE